MTTKCGYIAILGRPNVGKSTLLNALVGAKLAGVSDKVQTTRNRILGVWLEDQSELLFLDTPGLHVADDRPTLNKKMMREAWGALNDADLVIFLTDVLAPMNETDQLFLDQVLVRANCPVYLMATKGDKIKNISYGEVEKVILDYLGSRTENLDKLKVWQPLIISAKSPEDIQNLRSELGDEMPEGPWLFDPENLTDRSQKFIVSEYIREQIFRLVGDEIPYSSGVVVMHMDFSGSPVHIMADIYVERESHKRMIIGKGGQKIKKIGQNSRETIEKLLGDRVYLELFVKVKPGWSEKANLIREIAHLEN